jgi:hypothetical protein
MLPKDIKDPKVFYILASQLSFTAGCCSPKILVQIFRLDFPPTVIPSWIHCIESDKMFKV